MNPLPDDADRAAIDAMIWLSQYGLLNWSDKARLENYRQCWPDFCAEKERENHAKMENTQRSKKGHRVSLAPFRRSQIPRRADSFDRRNHLGSGLAVKDSVEGCSAVNPAAVTPRSPALLECGTERKELNELPRRN